MRFLNTVTTLGGICLMSGLTSFPTAEVTRLHPDPMTRLLSIRIFWVEPGVPSTPPETVHPPPAPGSGWDFRRYDVYRFQILSEEPPGDRGSSRALVVVPRHGARREHYALSSVYHDPMQGPRYRVDAVIGTRFPSRFGTVHTLNLARVAELPDFARDEVLEMIDMRVMEGNVYWEAAFELTGLHRDEVDWVEALGPALVRPPRKWVSVFQETLAGVGDEDAGGDGSCLRLGPFSLCMNMPKMIKSLSKKNYPREDSRIRVTRSLWHAGDSCGVVVAGRLLDYSIVTFRVRTNGNGAFPPGVRYLPSFDMARAQGWVRPQGEPPTDPMEGQFWSPRTRTRFPRKHRRTGRGQSLPYGWGPPRAAQPLPAFPPLRWNPRNGDNGR